MSNQIAELVQNSGLPGPRANLTLMYDFSKRATAAEITACLSLADTALQNTPQEFVVMCGVVAYCVQHKAAVAETLATIRPYAAHPCWRVREAVAIGIQEMAVTDLPTIIVGLEAWKTGSYLEQRAVVAGLCEPKLLKDLKLTTAVLAILQAITAQFPVDAKGLSDDQKILRKTLGYGLSVAVAAFPEAGQPILEALAEIDNPNIAWILKENLGKHRLVKLDAPWIQALSLRIDRRKA